MAKWIYYNFSGSYSGGVSPGNNGTAGTAGSLWTGTGAPPNALGTQGDFYFRVDGGSNTRIYQKTGASAWTALTTG